MVLFAGDGRSTRWSARWPISGAILIPSRRTTNMLAKMRTGTLDRQRLAARRSRSSRLYPMSSRTAPRWSGWIAALLRAGITFREHVRERVWESVPGDPRGVAAYARAVFA